MNNSAEIQKGVTAMDKEQIIRDFVEFLKDDYSIEVHDWILQEYFKWHITQTKTPITEQGLIERLKEKLWDMRINENEKALDKEKFHEQIGYTNAINDLCEWVNQIKQIEE